jgi:hypothetical protein
MSSRNYKSILKYLYFIFALFYLIITTGQYLYQNKYYGKSSQIKEIVSRIENQNIEDIARSIEMYHVTIINIVKIDFMFGIAFFIFSVLFIIFKFK